MNHKWKKIEDEEIIMPDNKKFNLHNNKECIHCKLRKGYVDNSNYNCYQYLYLIYYKDDVLLSRITLPYACINEEYKDFYFTEEDFNVQ